MNCDQVFNVLTRGPFPTGDSDDEEVEAHLEHCADCWRLAEALRPAVEVDQEAIPLAESRELPGYWGDARPSAGVYGHSAHSTLRTAVAPTVRPVAPPRWIVQGSSRDSTMLRDIVTVVGFLAAVTVTAVGVALLWQAWL